MKRDLWRWPRQAHGTILRRLRRGLNRVLLYLCRSQPGYSSPEFDYFHGQLAYWCDRKDLAQAYWLAAAERWHQPSQAALATRFPVGYGVEPYSELWIQWQRDAVEAGAAAAYRVLAKACVSGDGARPDPPRGLQILSDLAERGDLEAVKLLAKLYSRGVSGVPRDEDEARRWLLEGAKLGDAVCAHRLSLSYADGGSEMDADRTGAVDLGAAAKWALVARLHGYRGPQDETLDARIEGYLAELGEEQAAAVKHAAEEWAAHHPRKSPER